MGYKRIHVRVPLKARAIFSSIESGIHLTAQTINISQGGVAVTQPEAELPSKEYAIEIALENDQKINFSALLVRQTENQMGFKTLTIDEDNLAVIHKMVDDYQTTPEFIDQITEHDMLQQNYVDDDGNELEVTFDTDP